MNRDSWIVLLIVFLTFATLAIAMFGWAEYLLLRIDELEDELVDARRGPHAPAV